MGKDRDLTAGGRDGDCEQGEGKSVEGAMPGGHRQKETLWQYCHSGLEEDMVFLHLATAELPNNLKYHGSERLSLCSASPPQEEQARTNFSYFLGPDGRSVSSHCTSDSSRGSLSLQPGPRIRSWKTCSKWENCRMAKEFSPVWGVRDCLEG